METIMISTRRIPLWAPTIALALALGGCDGAPEGEPATPGAPAADPADVGKETITVDQETQVARAVKVADNHVRVDLFSREGEKLFEVDIRPTNGDDETLTWRLFPGTASMQTSLPETSGGFPSPYEEIPSLEECAQAAALIQGKVSAIINGPEYDSWGCDLPVRGLTSCGPKGRCCDTHDDCYARHHCNSSSWWKPWPFASRACKACNSAVVSCFTHVLPIGRSVCCARGTCGRPR